MAFNLAAKYGMARVKKNDVSRVRERTLLPRWLPRFSHLAWFFVAPCACDVSVL